MAGFGNYLRMCLGRRKNRCYDFRLTPQRRSELADPLEDAELVRARFPRVADYPDTAPMLAGTGDQEADAAFDLRFVHYMAGGESQSGNPDWDIVVPSVGNDDIRD